jgi:hypothetical protein
MQNKITETHANEHPHCMKKLFQYRSYLQKIGFSLKKKDHSQFNTKNKIIPGLIGLFDCCLLIVDGLTVYRELVDDTRLEASLVSMASTDAAPK